MHKRSQKYLVPGIGLGVLLIVVVVIVSRCFASPTAVIALSLNSFGKPELEYAGPGFFTDKCDMGIFNLQVDLSQDVSLIKAAGLFRKEGGHAMSIVIQSSALEPYNIRLIGFSVNDVADAPVEQLTEIIQMPAGRCRTNLDRFLLFTKKPSDDFGSSP